MKIDPRCPIDVMDYEILADDRGNARAYIKLRNMSSRAAVRLSAIVIWSNGAGESFETSLEAYDLVAPAGRSFTLTASTDRPLFPSVIEVRITKVAFEGERKKGGMLIKPKTQDRRLKVTLPFDAQKRSAPPSGADRAKKLLIRRTVTMLSLCIIIALAALIWRSF